jgi:hypothetical protein
VAFVDKNGMVYVSGHCSGIATITVETVDGKRQAKALLSVERDLAQGTPVSTVSGIGSYEGYEHLFSDKKVKRIKQPNVQLGASFNHGDKIINGDQITIVFLFLGRVVSIRGALILKVSIKHG